MTSHYPLPPEGTNGWKDKIKMSALKQLEQKAADNFGAFLLHLLR
jgi:hypothetical protein